MILINYYDYILNQLARYIYFKDVLLAHEGDNVSATDKVKSIILLYDK